MATKAKAAATPKVKPVKSGGAKVRSAHDVPRYFSEKDTQPIRDMYVLDGKGNAVFVKGLSEEQKVAQGVCPPLYKAPSFEKDDFERKSLNLVHTGRKGPTGGYFTGSRVEVSFKLIIHIPNPGKGKSFKTTYSYTCKPSEMPIIVKSFIDKEKGKSVSKAWYRGNAIDVTRI